MIYRKPNHCELAIPDTPQFRAAFECVYSGSGGSRDAQGTELRMLAVVSPDRRSEITRQLAPLKPDLLFLERLAGDAGGFDWNRRRLYLLPCQASLNASAP